MYSNRTRSGQRRLLNTRGVRDLREVLDQKRNEQECAPGQQQQQQQQLPPEPSFNYLKDPSREQNDWRNPKSNNKQYRTKHFTQSWQNRPNFQQRQPPQHHHHHQQQQQQNQDIENPCNIKIEFSTSSGEHTYTLDENLKLPTIKHVPDREVFTVRPNNYQRQRGGRRRFNNNRKYNTANKSMMNEKNDNSVDELATKSVGASQDSAESEIVQQLENVCLNHDQEDVDEEEVAGGGKEVEGEDEREVDKDKEHTVDKLENDKEENVDTKEDNSK